MRKFAMGIAGLFLACGAAVAADDIQIIEADGVNPERFGWTGVYGGVTGGYGWLKDIDRAFTPPMRASGEDWILGAHVGYLHEFGRFVVGAEAEALNLDIQFDGLPVWASEAYTLKARGGVALDRFLFTGHIGASYVNTTSTIFLYDGLADWALTYGAGLDYAITDNVIAGVSYSHMTSDRYDNTQIYADIDTFTARIGYKF